MSDTLHAALDYRRRGLPITLCPADGKNPLGIGWNETKPGKAWQQKQWKRGEILKAFNLRGELNVGCLWGPRSGMIDLECDSSEDHQTLAELFADCEPPITPTFQSTRGPHRLFAWHPDLDKLGKGTIHYHGLEIKIGANGKGSQSLLPPSTTKGTTRNWLVSLDECDPAPLPDKVLQRLFAEHSLTSKADYRDTEAIASVSLSLCKSDEAIAQAIAATVPSGAGHRHRRLFHFARLLKAIPSLAVADLQSVKPLVQKWYASAVSKIGTKQFDETWVDFANAWSNVKFPAGQEPIRMIYQQALSQALPPLAERYETVEVKRLIVLCRALQQAAGDKPFFLACRTAGELLGISHMMANKWLRLLQIDKVLLLVTPGSQNHAARYRYIGE